jgi:hypothetical protein
VVEVDLQSHGIQGLLGRDVLGMCMLVYNGQTGQIVVAF